MKDVDVARRELLVRDGKGGKDRVTLLPQSLIAALERQLEAVKRLHQRDLEAGWGRVVPHGIAPAVWAAGYLERPETHRSRSAHDG